MTKPNKKDEKKLDFIIDALSSWRLIYDKKLNTYVKVAVVSEDVNRKNTDKH